MQLDTITRGKYGIIRVLKCALRDAVTSEGSKQNEVAHMPNYITRTCPVCGKEYSADTQRLKHKRQTTCGRECSYKLRAEGMSTSVAVICERCGKSFMRNPAQIKDRNFCSVECAFPPDKMKRICPVCGIQFHARHSKLKQCSRKCFEAAHKTRMKGSGNPSYIDGRSIHKNYDAGSNWHEIRLGVYQRDKFTCQICGVKCIGKAQSTPENSHLIIQCHHIDPYKQSRNNDLSNLTTLCLRCHRTLHNRMEYG